MKIIDQSHKLQSSGHCCVCAGVCLHIWPTHLCARHERMETNRREGMVSTLSADDATIRGDNEMLRAERDELRAALAEANLKLEAVKAKVGEGLKASGTISNENRKLRAAIVEWDEAESADPEELTEDNLNQVSEWYLRHLGACDRLRAIAKGSALP